MPFQFGVGRVHDHHWGLIINPEILLAVVAQVTNDLRSLFLRRFAGDSARRFQCMVMLQNARGALHHMLGFFRFGGI